MNNVSYSFIVSALAGLSTMFGSVLILLKLKDASKVILRVLSFASGVMICICIIDLIPFSFKGFNTFYGWVPSILFVSIFMVVGIIIVGVIDGILPGDNFNVNNKQLYKVGFISMIAIILHNIPEGIITFMLSTHNLKLGISMALAIALHNIPEGVSISIPIYYGTGSKLKALLYTFISGMSELLGAILCYLFLAAFINDFYISCLLSVVAGIMLYISFYELMPISLSYRKKKDTLLFLMIGIMFMVINHFLLK